MQLIQKYIFIYFVVSLLNVKNIMNENNKLKNCINNILKEFQLSIEADSKLFSLIEESSVILKAFASGKLDISLNLDKNENRHNADNDIKQYSKVLMFISPITVYKGVHIIRKLKLFNNQQYFRIEGHITVIVELNKKQKDIYNQKCYSNLSISQGEQFNENLLIKNQIESIVPDQFIIFGNFNEAGNETIIVHTNGILAWNQSKENYIWLNLGWSSWSEWDACSKSCNGIQQRYRQYLGKYQDNPTSEINGYNIEQRECNTFKCEEAVNFLLFADKNERKKFNKKMKSFQLTKISALNSIEKDNFTIMFTIRSKIKKKIENISNEHLISIHSKSNDVSENYSSFTIDINENEIRIMREKNFRSEMFFVKSNLNDLKWHQFSFSFQKDGLVSCYMDCNWDRTIIMSKGSFDLPENQVNVEFNSKLKDFFEWKQFTVVSGDYARYQCSSNGTPIYDTKKIFKQTSIDEYN